MNCVSLPKLQSWKIFARKVRKANSVAIEKLGSQSRELVAVSRPCAPFPIHVLEIGEGKLLWVYDPPSFASITVDVSRVVATVKVSGSEHGVSAEGG